MPVTTVNDHQERSLDTSFDRTELPDAFLDNMKDALHAPADVRLQNLERLLMDTLVQGPDGETEPMILSVWDAAYRAQAGDLEAQKPRGDRVVVRTNPDGELLGVFQASEVPVDRQLERKAMQTAQHVAWGPAMNRGAEGHNSKQGEHIPVIRRG